MTTREQQVYDDILWEGLECIIRDEFKWISWLQVDDMINGVRKCLSLQ